jgi:ribosome modulation factor
MIDRLHPETIRTLRQLVKLHGEDRLILALKQMKIENESVARSDADLVQIATQRGFEERAEGRALTECNYVDPLLKEAWERGWVKRSNEES